MSKYTVQEASSRSSLPYSRLDQSWYISWCLRRLPASVLVSHKLKPLEGPAAYMTGWFISWFSPSYSTGFMRLHLQFYGHNTTTAWLATFNQSVQLHVLWCFNFVIKLNKTNKDTFGSIWRCESSGECPGMAGWHGVSSSRMGSVHIYMWTSLNVGNGHQARLRWVLMWTYFSSKPQRTYWELEIIMIRPWSFDMDWGMEPFHLINLSTK